MDIKGNAGSLVRAIADEEITAFVTELVQAFRGQVTTLVRQFVQNEPTPEQTLELENTLYETLREVGRQVLAWLFGSIEPPTHEMPGTVSYHEKTYRRLAEKSRKSDVLTRFGKVSFLRGRYRLGRAGRTIFPIEMLLGIEEGFTPAAATRVGKQFAACGSSQGRTLEMIADQMGARIGTEKLRTLIGTLAADLEPFRQEAQVQKLMGLIREVRENQLTPVLAVSRDGVALGMAPWSCFEMASVACVSVLAGGRKLGTVYLGAAPETNQATLSSQLTSLLTATIRECGEDVPEIVYVSDAGKVETAYWKNTLRHFFVDGLRIRITRVVDYYHAAERLTKIADALKFGKDKSKRQSWLKQVRVLLLEPRGHGRVLRSIAKMREIYGYKAAKSDEAEKSERYLRRYRRFMQYADMKARGYPIGSGVVESACKQVISERMKLSGMRWHKGGGQRTITLRCLLLSGIWDTVYKSWLISKSALSDFMTPQTT